MSDDISNEIAKATPSREASLDFTDRFRVAFDTFCDSAEDVSKFLKESLEVDYWKGAEYDNWQEWYETEYQDQISFLKDVKLSIDTRADIIQSLANGGLTKREIADTIGVSTKTVHRTLSLTEDDHGTFVPRSTSDDDVSAGQSVETVGHIDERSVPSPFVSDDEPPVVKMSQAFYEPNNDEEPAEEVDRFAGINFDALILPTSNQIVLADPTPDTPDYFEPRTVAPSWSPPQVAELPPPVAKRYDDDQPEFLAQPMKLEKPRDPNKSDEKHCRTCACMLLP